MQELHQLLEGGFPRKSNNKIYLLQLGETKAHKEAPESPLELEAGQSPDSRRSWRTRPYTSTAPTISPPPGTADAVCCLIESQLIIFPTFVRV